MSTVAEVLGEHPTLVGCSLGKDRTGLVVALILFGIGVRQETIVDDFTLSTTCLTEGRSLLGERWWMTPNPMISPAAPEVMTAVLDQIDRTDLTPHVENARRVLLPEEAR